MQLHVYLHPRINLNRERFDGRRWRWWWPSGGSWLVVEVPVVSCIRRERAWHKAQQKRLSLVMVERSIVTTGNDTTFTLLTTTVAAGGGGANAG